MGAAGSIGAQRMTNLRARGALGKHGCICIRPDAFTNAVTPERDDGCAPTRWHMTSDQIGEDKKLVGKWLAAHPHK